MMTINKTFKLLNCLRCKHEWISKRKQLPKVCPKCKSPYWNKKRERCPHCFKRFKTKWAYTGHFKRCLPYLKALEVKDNSSKVELIDKSVKRDISNEETRRKGR